ncbi:MAG: putative transporter [Muribaculaceae bacterium]|nr:putative transporter [Muribaculaceae bacterium]
MDFICNLLGPGNDSLANTLILYSFVIALGIAIGKIKIAGISLGVTFVLFVGILMGQLGYVVNPKVLQFVREFGLIIFIFAIGLQVGPSFFSAFKTGGMRLNMLAALGVLLNVLVALGIYFWQSGNTSIDVIVGIMSGAVTNTPGLAAAQQAVNSPEMVNTMSMGYAAAYPLGVIGIILAMLIIKKIFNVKIENEIQEIEDDRQKNQLQPLILTFEVNNKLIEGKNLAQLHDIIRCNFVVSRLMRTDGSIVIPVSTTTLNEGDHICVVMSAQDEHRFAAMVGPEIDKEWESDPKMSGDVVSRRIVITKSEYNGVALGSLRLHNGYHLNATRVNRAGVDLLASADLRLQLGDRITVVGNLDDINRLADKMGNSLKRLNQPNLITIFVGIMLGIILGSINLGFGLKLGLAGGPLVVAILLSRFGYKLKLVTYTSSSASLLMRELGICLFLASVGIAAGGNFCATVFNPTGAQWVLWGFMITFIPLMIVGCIARGVYKINYLSIQGLLSGGYTDPPALAYANGSTGNDTPAVAYSTVYPLTMFLRVVAAQVLVQFAL